MPDRPSMNPKLVKLEEKLEAVEPDSQARVDLLISIAEELVSGDDPRRMADVTAEARALSEKLGYRAGEAYSLLYESAGHCFVSNHELGLKCIDRSKSIFETLGNEDGVAKTSLMEGNLLRSIGSFDGALAGMYKALELFSARGDHFWEAGTLYDLGLLYLETRDYKKAKENFEGCVKTMESLSPDSWMLGRALNGLGTTLKHMGHYDEAIEYNHRGLAIFQKIGHRMGEARALDDIGAIYYKAGDPEMALAFHRKSLEIRQNIGQRRAQSTSLLNIARVHLQRGETGPAFDALREALHIAAETKAKPQIYEANELLSQAYEIEGELENALNHHKEFQRIKEEVFNDQTTDRMHKLQIGFEVQHAEKEAEIARLKNVELREKNERLEQLLLELREAQSQLVQAEKMAALGKLVAGLVHEINTPLGAGNSAIDVSDRCIKKMEQLQAECESLEELCSTGQLQSLLARIHDSHKITRSANERITRILGNLRSFSRLDGGERQRVDLHDGIESTLALLEHEWKDRIEIVRSCAALPTVPCYPGEINQIFMALLSNAVESITGKGTIKIRTFTENGQVHVEIADTGIGIPQDQLDHLFDPGFSTKGARVKAGMSLLASLNIARKHKGRIDVTSEVGKGSTFTVVIPEE